MGRIESLRLEMAQRGLDAMLVTQPENRRYISGFTGSSGVALVTSESAWFVTDFRYIEQATAQCTGFEIVDQAGSLHTTLENLLTRSAVKKVGFEQDFVTYGEALIYRGIEPRVAGLEFLPTSRVTERLRVVKDEDEIGILETAAKIADAAFTQVLGILRPGLTEREVALELEFFMKRNGAEGVAFETIAASGWRSALPHGVASDKVLETGDLLTLDFGALYQGYHSDITRTVVIGKPSDKQRDIYQIVLEAQHRALEAATAGMTGRELDAIARDYISSKGYGEAFGHSLGHGIGLAIHEDPRVAKTSEDVLQTGMVVTVEPGIYLAGWGGVRIEDDIVLLPSGSRILTHSPKLELISIS